MSDIYSQTHSILHIELANNGWIVDKNKSNSKKFIYSNRNPYDEFILDYSSTNEIAVTVPINRSSIAYRNTFQQKDIQIIQEYLNMHLDNYKC